MDFEKLGAFYLGKEYDLTGSQLLDRLVMYDARDLTTHAVCVGMTGSGKTGLCLGLLEEAAIDHVPAIIIDPKGDITNLLLTFPGLFPEEFRPWVNPDDARRKGLNMDEYAAQQAELWRNGLAQWGQDSARIRMLRDSAEFVIFTPGSDAGIPVSILQSFNAPTLDWDTEAELLQERIQGTVSALLGLIGVDADPVRSREHILLTNLFEHFWRRGEDLDLPKLILSIQNPPIRQLGVFDIDTFFPPKDRFGLAMSLNNIIAAPAFQSWLQGQPLDVAGFLSTPAGKPRHSIFYIAHLSDAERMFFVAMLLNQVITWIRTQPGTTSLRALLYMDEIFGFFPPVANPPSKLPLLTLLKQARAFGLGVVLTTQNPVDLDYKGLTNAGTWFIGRLQTERDKMRVLDGLEGASSSAGRSLNRDELSRLISALRSRVFLLHNVHEETPVTFQSRWAMSYLRGPLTRTQVRELMRDQKLDQPAASPMLQTGLAQSQPPSAVQTAMPSFGEQPATSPPALSADIQQVYLPIRKEAAAVQLDIEAREGGSVEVKSRELLYEPAVLGMGRLHYLDRRRKVDEQETFALLTTPPADIGTLHWDQAQALDLKTRDLRDVSEQEAHFGQLPEAINEVREFKALKENLADHLYRTSSITLLYSPVFKAFSQPNESEREFRMRLQQSAREQRDEEVDKLNRRYENRLRKLGDQLRRAETALTKKQAEAAGRKRDVYVSVGVSVLGVLLGRRSTRSVSTTFGKVRMSSSASMSVEEAQEKVEALQGEVTALEEELKEQASAITSRWDAALEAFEEVPVTPRKQDVDIDVFALAWAPHWKIHYQAQDGAARIDSVPAF
jgi:hypothetical protein